ncbi:MAG: RsmE family RNA methyltransferase, partial [Pseudomonadota bacterium]|nr:RsmE family RNA methyltransferase [Pseudomonadota bacterium]
MRVPRLHVSPPLAVGASVVLEGAAFHHLVRVLRAREGAAVRLFTGEGGEYAAVVTRITRRAAEVRVEAYHPGGVESPLHVVLAQGVSRGERMDYT